MKPKTLILRTAGTNCDLELAHAFELAGSETQALHLNQLVGNAGALDEFDMLGIPGGFSYGDDIAAGKILAGRLQHRLMEALKGFVLAGKPVIGICNGFQVLVKTGLLPGFDLQGAEGSGSGVGSGVGSGFGGLEQLATLTNNAKPRFVDKWVGMKVDGDTKCIWTQGLETFDLPIAHGEGRFVAGEDVLDRIEAQRQVALRYAENPNGSKRDIAGICDPSGLVLGLMPHPERFTHATHHPTWTRGEVEIAGLKMFENAVRYCAEGAAV